MAQFYSRKERRALERMAGLKATTPEVRRRKLLAGKALQNQFAEYVAQEQDKAAQEKEAQILQHLIEDGKTEEQAKEWLKEQYDLQRKQLEKKSK